mmetsp:Transcript_52911/g.114417  ORF Transcript_52911/g.114417 Transcript_52911/m.114417 type:complete len:300 (+) Transcript_52911:871-1770(+)
MDDRPQATLEISWAVKVLIVLMARSTTASVAFLCSRRHSTPKDQMMLPTPCPSNSCARFEISAATASIMSSLSKPSLAKAQHMMEIFCGRRVLNFFTTSVAIASNMSLTAMPSFAKAQQVLARSWAEKACTFLAVSFAIASIIMAFSTPAVANAQDTLARSWGQRYVDCLITSQESSSKARRLKSPSKCAEDQASIARSWGMSSSMRRFISRNATSMSSLGCSPSFAKAQVVAANSWCVKSRIVLAVSAAMASMAGTSQIACLAKPCARFESPCAPKSSIRSTTFSAMLSMRSSLATAR